MMTDIEAYYANTQLPWGKMFYQMVWEQLSFARNMRVLDFGSGFGITSNHLAAENTVVAIEPNEEMRKMRVRGNAYEQIAGSLETLPFCEDKRFNLVVCHNVLEYINDKESVLCRLGGLLNTGGVLSIVKHNHLGRVMQKAVFENDAAQALALLNGEAAYAQSFGEIKYYDSDMLRRFAGTYNMQVTGIFGIRTFFALYPDNTVRQDKEWTASMLALERKASNMEAFRNVAFYNHILMKKA